MVCMNWLLAVCSVVTFLSVVWPGFGTEMTVNWVVGIAMVVVLLVAWKGVSCKPCAVKAEAGKKGKKKKK